MSIETLDDIVEELADKFGIYGTGPEEGDHPDDCKCRMCFCGWLMSRIEKAVKGEATRLTSELKRADKNYFDLKNEFDQCVQVAREDGKKAGYEESMKRAIDIAVFNIPYISKFQNTPARLLGIVVPE